LGWVGMAVLMMTTVALGIFSCRFIGRTKWDTLGLGIRYGREGTFAMMTVWTGLPRFECLVLNAMEEGFLHAVRRWLAYDFMIEEVVHTCYDGRE